MQPMQPMPVVMLALFPYSRPWGIESKNLNRSITSNRNQIETNNIEIESKYGRAQMGRARMGPSRAFVPNRNRIEIRALEIESKESNRNQP